MQQLATDMGVLRRCVGLRLPRAEFLRAASERFAGQWQLSTSSHNIRRGDTACKHACTYCYVAPMFRRWGRPLAPPPDMEDAMPVDAAKVAKRWRSPADARKRQLVFFPSTSDIFAENARDYAEAVQSIVGAGHEIMWVTKAHLRDVRAVAEALEAKGAGVVGKVSAYVTVTSDDDATLARYEPRAAPYAQRLEAIAMLAGKGFHVSAMVEPYLSDPVRLVNGLLGVVPQAGVVAVGKMNYSPSMRLSDDDEADAAMKQELGALYSAENVRSMWAALGNNPRVVFKKETALAVLDAFKSVPAE
eukprot:m51a1_g7634 hypothetical protein (303) ;mRNA; r:328933-329841